MGQRLRQSFRTIATAAGVSEIDAKLLMNHAIPGVNAGYITRHKLLEKSSSRSTAGNKQSRVCAHRRFARQTFRDPELALRRCCATGGLGGKDRSMRSCSDGLKRSDGELVWTESGDKSINLSWVCKTSEQVLNGLPPWLKIFRLAKLGATRADKVDLHQQRRPYLHDLICAGATGAGQQSDIAAQSLYLFFVFRPNP